MKYYDVNDGKLYTLREIERIYNDFISEQNEDKNIYTLNNYINDCTENGTLTEISGNLFVKYKTDIDGNVNILEFEEASEALTVASCLFNSENCFCVRVCDKYGKVIVS